jgi:hypothetical protein
MQVISLFFENLKRKLMRHWNLTTITVTLHEEQCAFLIVSHWILFRMRIFSDKSCRGNQNTRFMFNFFFGKRAVYRKMWKNIVEYSTSRPGQRWQYDACALLAG